MRLVDWPVGDRQAWEDATRAAGPGDLIPPPAARLRPSTRGQYENGYGRWLRWLETNGLLDAGASPGARASEDRVRRFYKSLRDDGLADYSVAGLLMSIAQVLRFMEPGVDFAWIAQAARRVHKDAKHRKNPAEGLVSAGDLFQLGIDLMDEAEGGRFRSQADRALLFRDGLLIALLAARPLRSKNVVQIEIGRHLFQAGATWRLAFSGADMKNGHPLACSWPGALRTQLARYLDHYRPLLLPKTSEHQHQVLWPSNVTGRPMRGGDINVRVKHWTSEAFGKPINPHRFRHAAATTVSVSDPESATENAAILGHSTLKTSARHYNLATAVEATERWQGLVATKRRRLGVKNPNPSVSLPLFDMLVTGAEGPFEAAIDSVVTVESADAHPRALDLLARAPAELASADG